MKDQEEERKRVDINVIVVSNEDKSKKHIDKKGSSLSSYVDTWLASY